jgi:hypothetical protein
MKEFKRYECLNNVLTWSNLVYRLMKITFPTSIMSSKSALKDPRHQTRSSATRWLFTIALDIKYRIMSFSSFVIA